MAFQRRISVFFVLQQAGITVLQACRIHLGTVTWSSNHIMDRVHDHTQATSQNILPAFQRCSTHSKRGTKTNIRFFEQNRFSFLPIPIPWILPLEPDHPSSSAMKCYELQQPSEITMVSPCFAHFPEPSVPTLRQELQRLKDMAKQMDEAFPEAKKKLGHRETIGKL